MTTPAKTATTVKKTTTRPGARKTAAPNRKGVNGSQPAPTGATADSVKVSLNFTKETPGTYRYDVDPADVTTAPVTSLYVRKMGFPQGAPQTVTVTVTAG